MLAELGRQSEAASAFDQAIALTNDGAIQAWLEQKKAAAAL